MTDRAGINRAGFRKHAAFVVGALASVLAVGAIQCRPVAAEPLERGGSGEGYSVGQFSQLLKLKSNAELLKSRVAEGRQLIQTPLGEVAMRWPRAGVSTETVRASESVRIAWSAVAGALGQLGFPERVRSANYDWNLVLQNGVPTGGKGRLLSSAHCHTAWMGPPADIVINYDRLLDPCGGATSESVPSQVLTGALIHEIAHAVEFQLLGSAFSRRQRWHSEGFATWFESVVIDGMPNLKHRQALNSELRERAKRVFRESWSPYTFDGSPADYAKSFALISTLVDVHGVSGLVAVYNRMSQDNCVLAQAVEREFGWDQKEWWHQARQLLDSTP